MTETVISDNLAFTDLGLAPELLRALTESGYTKPTPIQAQAIQSNGGQNYVQLQWIEKWDGKLPSTVLNGSNGMMLNMGK